MNDDKGIAGFKKSEFANATPDKVFSGADVRAEDLPEGVRLYMREKAIDLGNKKVSVNVYRLVDDGSLKNKRTWVGKMKMNRKPEDEEIAEQFGGGSFLWILKWVGPDGVECGIISETIEIDEQLGRAANEAWRRKQMAVLEPAPAATVPAVPAPAAAFGSDAMALLKVMELAEEKTLLRFERMAAIFQGQRNETPADVLQSAYKGASEMMQRAVETNLSMAKAVNKANEKSLVAKPEDVDEDGPVESDGPKMPAWLDAFMPHIEAGIGKLLNGGPVASAVKTLILSSDEWNEIFRDKEKWGEAVSAMEKHFGSERTGAALDILLNRRKAEAKKGKGK